MATKKKELVAAKGFGVPLSEIDPPRFKVEIGKSTKPVLIKEDFGVMGLPANDHFNPEHLDESVVTRCELPYRHWVRIRKPIAQAFRTRLAERGIDTANAKWDKPGETVEIQRLLGRELCVLAWAIEAIDEDDKKDLVGKAVSAWENLRPEERWWLYAMAAANSGTPNFKDVGWRKALRVALTEGGDPVEYRHDLFDR